MKQHKISRRVLGLVSLVLCLCFGLAFLNEYMVDKGHYRDLKRILYTDAKNSYDLLFAGGSHMSGAINPQYFEKEFGVKSFNTSTGGQEFYETYYLLKEVLKRQSPQVVVLDIYYALNNSPYGDESFAHRVLDPMKLSSNKIEAIQASVAPKSRKAYFFPFLLYHDRWSDAAELVQEWSDYIGEYTGALGFAGGAQQYGKAMTYDDWAYSVCTPLAEKQEAYLQKFFQLAQDENFQLVLINFPCEMDSDELTEWAGDAPGKLNQIRKEAAAAGVLFLDLNRPEQMEQMGFDFATMMNNASHVNYNGAYTVTEYVGKYLQTHASQLFNLS